MPDLNTTMSHNPQALLRWVVATNAAHYVFDPIRENSYEDAYKLCVLFGARTINFDEWMWKLQQMELFDVNESGLWLENYHCVAPDAYRHTQIVLAMKEVPPMTSPCKA